jgi:hypothetical protein
MELETKEFNAHVQQMMKKYPKSAQVVLKKFALDLLRRIVMNTPVDTGRARAAWYPSMVALGLTVPLATGDTKAESIAKGKTEGSYKDRTRGPGLRYIDLINAVKYIIYLEYGYSKQAPYGMVRLSMRQLRGGKLPKELGARMRKDWKRGVGYFPTLESGKF